MNRDQFWQLIDEARRDVPAANPEEVSRRMTRLLAARPATEIIAAHQILWDLMADSYRSPLWAAAYLINGGCSDDGFDYFRGWLILQGRETFERVVADPDSLADLPYVQSVAADGTDIEHEAALGMAWEAYRVVSGAELPDDSITIDYPEIEFDFDFEDDEEMANRLPRLAELFDIG